MWPKFGNSSIASILQGFEQQNRFFWGVHLVQVNLGLALGTNLKLYTSVQKG